ncbi:MAG: hypothetical protein JWO06_801 [Bacteroidota bacterium]|nr:hypothetical protein [Bacteroidota bacterium]
MPAPVRNFFEFFFKSVFSKSVLALVFCATVFLARKPAIEARVLTYDTCGYYMYLPTIFYDNILDPQNISQIREEYNPSPGTPWEETLPLDNGRQVMRYTAGMSIMYLPAFIVAHFWAKYGHYKVDGFSFPYQYLISLWSVLIGCIGLNYMRKNLLLFFNDNIAALGVLIIGLGTNFLFYSSSLATMAHSYVFCLYAMLIWFTHKASVDKEYRSWMIAGFITALIILCRPMEAACVFIPLLWVGTTNRQIREKLLPHINAQKKRLKLYMGWAFAFFIAAVLSAGIVHTDYVYFLLTCEAGIITHGYPHYGNYFITMRGLLLHLPVYNLAVAVILGLIGMGYVVAPITKQPGKVAEFAISLVKNKRIISFIMPIAVMLFLQLLYWKLVSGHWFVSLYRKPSDYFSLDLQISYALLSYQRGWLMYSPIFLLAFPGIYLLYKNYKPLFFVILVPISIQAFITLAFQNKDFGGGIGHRNFVSVYALWIIPLMVFINYALKRNKLVTYSVIAILCWISFSFNVSNTPQTPLSKSEYWERFCKLRGVKISGL